MRDDVEEGEENHGGIGGGRGGIEGGRGGVQARNMF